jgi:hypothetical protein
LLIEQVIAPTAKRTVVDDATARDGVRVSKNQMLPPPVEPLSVKATVVIVPQEPVLSIKVTDAELAKEPFDAPPQFDLSFGIATLA